MNIYNDKTIHSQPKDYSELFEACGVKNKNESSVRKVLTWVFLCVIMVLLTGTLALSVYIYYQFGVEFLTVVDKIMNFQSYK